MMETAYLLGIAALVALAAYTRGASGRDTSARRVELHLPLPSADRGSDKS